MHTTDSDIKNIELLLSEKKYDEARAIITAALEAKFSPEEKGAALTGMASVYLDISNTINMRYRDALQEAIAGMKKINSAETDISEKIKLAEVRDKLNS
ncbi:MAG: hypothetical protein AAB726_00155 [Patescibacteria group bacterium]